MSIRQYEFNQFSRTLVQPPTYLTDRFGRLNLVITDVSIISIFICSENIGLQWMGTCHPMATLKYIDSVTSLPQMRLLLYYKLV